MASRNKFLIIFLCCLLSVSYAFPQTSTFNEDWRWVSFTTESGLPSNIVKQLIETTDGTVWVITSAGLAWYDGFRWYHVDNDSLPQSIPHWISPFSDDSITVVDNFQLLIGTKNGFHPIPLSYNDKKVYVSSTVRIKDHPLIVAGSIDGITMQTYSFDGQLHLIQLPDIIAADDGQILYQTRNDNIWVNTREGIYMLEGNHWTPRLKKNGDALFRITSIIEDQDTAAYVSINQPDEALGIWKFDKRGHQNHRLHVGVSHIRSMDISPDGDMMVAYESGEVQLQQGNRWSSISPRPQQLTNILFLKYRENGDLWVGTDHGLFLFRHPGFRWTYWKQPSPSLYDHIHEIIQTHDSSIWLATANGLIVHDSDNAVRYIDRIENVRLIGTTGLCQDDQHNIWISSGGIFKGVYMWNGRSWRHYGKRDGILIDHIHKIRKDTNGNLWFLGLGDENSTDPPGTYLYSDGRFINWGEQNNLRDQRVYSVAQSADSILAFGTRYGIYIYKNGRCIFNSKTALKFPASVTAFAMTFDREGKIWVADRNSGLQVFTERGEKQRLSTVNGLINDQVWDVTCDLNGTVWAGTQGGISNYHDGQFSSFDLSSGLNSQKIWPIYPTKNKIYIGTTGNGVAILDLKEQNNPRPRVEIEQPITEDDNCAFRWHPFSYWGEVPSQRIETRWCLDDGSWSRWGTTQEIRLSGLLPGQHTFQVQAKGLFGYYDSLGQSAAFKIKYPFYQHPSFAIPIVILSLAFIYLAINAYIRKRKHERAIHESEARLRAITETTTSAIFIYDRSLILLYVNSGAENLMGCEKSKLLSMHFTDLVPAYSVENVNIMNRAHPVTNVPYHSEVKITTCDKTEKWVDISIGQLTFQGIPASLCTAIDITQRKLAEEKLLSYQSMLRSAAEELTETEERERRRMAAYLHDYIGQSLALSRIKLGSNDDIISPSNLNDIRRHIDEASEHIQSLTFDLSPPVLYELSFEDAIEWLTERFESDHHLPVSFFHEKFELNIEHHLRVLLFHAIRELLHNIVKHAEAYSAKVTLRVIKDQVIITIQDDGKGFDPYAIPDNKNHKGGFGLFNIRERLHQFNGGMTIESRIGHGTMITIRIPLDKSTSKTNT
jgi:two-component system, NarL family, sensor histidine kinase UhpB